jgi:phage gp29-like protein
MSKPKKTQPLGLAVSRVADAIRYAPNPLPQLTPQNLAAYLDSFSRGYLRETALLWHAIQWRDDRVGADSAKRHKSIARYNWQVVPAAGADPAEPAVGRHIEAIKYALENCTARDALDASVRGGAALLARQMMRAVGFQWQVHELVWQPSPAGLTFEATAMPLWWFERTTGALRFLPHDLALEGLPLEPDGWLVTRGDGLMAATALLYLLKRMALSDWALYNGRVGPGIHGQTAAAAGSPEWTALEDAVDNFGFDLKIVTQDGVTITPIEMALKGALPWPEMYNAMLKAITVLWRGGNLLSDSAGAQPGAAPQTGVTLQGAEAALLEQDDAEMLSDALNDYIVAPLIRYRFGAGPLAWVEWQTSAKPDQKAEIETDRFLAERGWPFALEDLAERYGRTPPAEGQTVLAPPQPALPAAANAAPPPLALANRKESPTRPARPTSPTAERVQAELAAAGAAALAKAESAAWRPLAERLAGITELEDSALMTAALRKLKEDLPELAKDLLADPAAAAELEQILSAALLNGYAEGAAKREAA